MPLYDFRCPAGHVIERRVALGVAVVECACGARAKRLVVPLPAAHVMAAKPPINLKRALEADAEVKHAYQRAGVEPPDFPGAARRVVADMRRKGIA